VLKWGCCASDSLAMARELECPTCDAPLVLQGDEKTGDEVFCTTCGAPSLLKLNEDRDEIYAEEDY